VDWGNCRDGMVGGDTKEATCQPEGRGREDSLVPKPKKQDLLPGAGLKFEGKKRREKTRDDKLLFKRHTVSRTAWGTG